MSSVVALTDVDSWVTLKDTGIYLLVLALWGLPLAAGTAEPNEFQSVLVKPGDTLWAIAQTYLKDPRRWDEIIKHNRLPSNDPSLALPGMTLRVPVALIKDELRSANLIYRLNDVLFRRKDSADWKAASDNLDLYRNDSLRTLESSRARLRFLETDLLELEANSMAVIKPTGKDHDLELKRAGTYVGKAKIMTATAKITPRTRDTEYVATVKNDLSTLVEVSKGKASVEAEGKSVDVLAGMDSQVVMGLPPSLPGKIADLPAFNSRVEQLKGRLVAVKIKTVPAAGAGAAAGIRSIRAEVDTLSIGAPVSGYRIQFSLTEDFTKTVFNKGFEVDYAIKAGDITIAPGSYWVRIALIDLLGAQGRYSKPKLYDLSPDSLTLIGSLKKNEFLTRYGVSADTALQKPATDETVVDPRYQVLGHAIEGMSVIINGEKVRLNAKGNFSVILTLSAGRNKIRLNLIDEYGNMDSIERTVTYTP